MSRPYTNKLIELCDETSISKEMVFDELMCYLSEAEIEEFCKTGWAGELAEEFKDLED